MDFGSILAAANSLKVASDIAVGLVNLKTTSEVQAKAIELNQKILAAQQDLFTVQAAQSALVNEVRELKDEIARMKDWEAQKQRYKLAAPFPGCFVYALKKSMSEGEPPHYICTHCHESGKRSILQISADTAIRTSFMCPDPSCKSVAHTPWRGGVELQYAEEL